MASCVLLSALAIPPYDKASGAMTDAQTELEHERSMRMAAILGFSVVRRVPRLRRIHTLTAVTSRHRMPGCCKLLKKLEGDELRRRRSCRHSADASCRVVVSLQDAKQGVRNLLSRHSLLAELQAKGVLNIIPQVPHCCLLCSQAVLASCSFHSTV